jgi:isopenicillin-N epimerase
MDQDSIARSVQQQRQYQQSSTRSLWGLDSGIAYLNHGSYGACPLVVLDYQQQLRSRMERDPVFFFAHELEFLLDDARRELAEFVGADPANLVFVPNATTGVNAVLRSLSFQLGDELLITNHTYNAVKNAVEFVATWAGAKVIVAEIPFPLESAKEVTAAILSKISSKTRLVLLDHVTSPTAMVLPLETIIPTLEHQGIEVLVDGAHAPGMIPLNLQTLGATYYTGNCHKWLCAPKGAGFLYVQPDRQAQIRPPVISHGANSPRSDRSRFQLEFDWMGTDDPTAYLSVPAAIRFMASQSPDGWLDVFGQNRAMAIAARELLLNHLGMPAPCPELFLGTMATIPLPPIDATTLQTILYDHFRIQVPVIDWPVPNHEHQRWIRISAQIYNTLAEYEYLAQVLAYLQDRGEQLPGSA